MECSRILTTSAARRLPPRIRRVVRTVCGAAVFFFGLVSAAVAGSFPARLRIHDAVQVEGETVKLSDLLPPDSPGELQEKCSRLVLGDTPLPGSRRSISRVQIERQLRRVAIAPDRWEIPDSVTITRRRRRLSTAEILKAIETALASEGSSRFKAPSLNGLQLQAPVFVTKPDPGLEVKSTEYDPVQRKTRFLLWPSKEPQVLPFYVMVKGTAGTAGVDDFREWVDGLPRANTRKRESPAKAASAVLVAAGKPAKLIVETPAMRMSMSVTPLEPGVKGQLIRVRNQDTRRVVEAQVIGSCLLQAELGTGKGETTR